MTKKELDMDHGDCLDEWIAFKPDLFKQDFGNGSAPQSSGINGKVVRRRNSLSSISSPLSRFSFCKSSSSTASSRQSSCESVVAATKSRPQFLVGYNRLDNIVAVTLLEESRRFNHDRPTSMAVCLQLSDLIELNNNLSLIYSQVSFHFDTLHRMIQCLQDQNSKLYFFKYIFG